MKKKEKIKKLFKSKELKQTKHYSKKVSIFALILMAVLLLILTAVGFLFIKHEFSDTHDFENLVKENYFLSVLVMIVVCALQVMVALIPSEIVEIASGYAFGALAGSIYCLIGITLGSIIVISLTRKYGRRFVESLYPREKIDSLPILRSEKKLNITVLILFAIPGTPKDLITYVIGLTKMSIPTYILLTTLVRFPSIVVSTISGGALENDKFYLAAIFFIISLVTGGVGYLAYTLISKKNKKKDGKSSN